MATKARSQDNTEMQMLELLEIMMLLPPLAAGEGECTGGRRASPLFGP